MTALGPPGHPSTVPPSQAGPALPGRRPRGRSGWPPWIAWVGLLSGFAVVVVIGTIVGAIAAASGVDVKKELPPDMNIGLTLFQNLALFATAVLFARNVSRRRPAAADFGLGRPRHVGLSVGLLLAVWAGFFALSTAWTLLLGLHEKSDLPQRLGADLSPLYLVIVTVLVTVIAPIGEELFFRAFFFGALRNWKGPWPAAVFTGIVFGAIHLGSAPVGQLVPLAFFGFGLCLLYHWTGSLYPCIALHALNNSIAFGVGEGWNWQIPLVMLGSVLVALTLAEGLRRALDGSAGDGGRRAAAAAQG